MREIKFEFSDIRKVNGAFHYAREGLESAKLSYRFSMYDPDLPDVKPKNFSIQLNAIGGNDPVSFLWSLDEGYLNDKVSGISVKHLDLFETIQNVRKRADILQSDLSPALNQRIETLITAAAASFQGDDHRDCIEALFSGLRRLDIPDFQDDVHHLAGYRKSFENVLFHNHVWPTALDALEDWFDLHPDVAAELEDIVMGRETAAKPSEEDDDYEMECM